MNRQIRQVAFLVLVMFTALALSVTSVQGLARPSVWEPWSANGALNSDPRNRRTVSRNFDTERGPILLAGGTTIASTPEVRRRPGLRGLSARLRQRAALRPGDRVLLSRLRLHDRHGEGGQLRAQRGRPLPVLLPDQDPHHR